VAVTIAVAGTAGLALSDLLPVRESTTVAADDDVLTTEVVLQPEEVVEEYVAAFNQRDLKALLALFSPEARIAEDGVSLSVGLDVWQRELMFNLAQLARLADLECSEVASAASSVELRCSWLFQDSVTIALGLEGVKVESGWTIEQGLITRRTVMPPLDSPDNDLYEVATASYHEWLKEFEPDALRYRNLNMPDLLDSDMRIPIESGSLYRENVHRWAAQRDNE
jgi:hypothetical protein